jgi:hypothetical protein
MTRWFDRIIAIALLFSCAILTATVWQRRNDGSALAFRHPTVNDAAGDVGSVRSAEYRVGERLGLLEGIDFAKSNRTLLAFVASNCQFCIDSVPLYRAVEADRDRTRNGLLFVIAGREPLERLRAFATQYRLRPDRIVTLLNAAVGIRMTPTLVLVDRAGIVEQVWLGEQTGARGEAVLQHLQGNTP